MVTAVGWSCIGDTSRCRPRETAISPGHWIDYRPTLSHCEVMGYASILLAGIWAATATMDLRYRAQVPYDAPLPLVAGLTDTRGRRVRTWSRLHLPSGEVGAEATALLVALPEDLAARARELYGPMA